MTDQKQTDESTAPIEKEESGAGYGNNAGDQGAGEVPDETQD